MNELRISGKVINSYLNENGHFVCTVAVVHDHVIDGNSIVTESIFRAVLPDRVRSESVDIITGDRVEIEGYIRQDRRLSATGKERKSTGIYINNIELLED